jgi:NADPH2:quinone reductase
MGHAMKVIGEVLEMFSSGKMKPILYDPIYDGLENVSTGLIDLENRKTWGKGVIRIAKSDKEATRAKL